MYDMYPEWGPARHRTETETDGGAVQAAMDLRDNGGSWGAQRPDDN